MMHPHRSFCLSPVETAEDLAGKLTEQTWTLCTGFFVQGHEEYLFLNDATSEDGAAEFAIVVRHPGENHFIQIESVTFSWCTLEKALLHIQRALAGAYDDSDFARPLVLKVETPENHGRCPLCA